MTRLLLIDDHAELRLLARWSLDVLPGVVEIAEAGTAEEGLRLAREWRPDVVLLDVMMPGMNGLEACRLMRAEPQLSHTHVVLLSARGQASDLEAGRAAGASAYMVKPFSPQRLAQTIELLLNRPPRSNRDPEGEFS